MLLVLTLVLMLVLMLLLELNTIERFSKKERPNNDLPIPHGYGYNQITSNLLRSAMGITSNPFRQSVIRTL